MTAGNNGTGTPQDDDPFAYLYRSEGGEQGGDGAASAPQPGVPRTSYNQVRPVGSRQYGPQGGTYGGQTPGGTYGGGQPMPAHQPAPHYAAPETLPGGAPRHPASGHGGHAAAERPKRRGLLVAAIAVVLVVAGGIGVAMLTNSGNSDDKSNAANSTSQPSSPSKDKPTGKKDGSDDSKDQSAAGELKRDAASLKLMGGATTAKDIKGAQADGGTYITGMNKPGAAVEWTVNVPDGGDYTLVVTYGVPGVDANSTIWINGERRDQVLSMKNFAQAKAGEWDRWTHTWAWISLKKGSNTVKLSCEQGNQCNFNLDQMWLKPGQTKG
ncbi:carbohydrate-binding protein [Streptomyces orinoci]|uniref:Carbohydrate-binding protein n=1 Tax=Streptomyces orinoci TaxID=67339 RepID=A0ABV3JTW5_STRON|nr:carbohydrate-binding protein [Streptomyces orinoci]